MSQNFTEFYKPWFASTPVNAKKSSTTIGAGVDGVVTITSAVVGTEGNSISIQVALGVGVSVPLSAVLTGNDILVTLGTDGASVLDATKNTALLIASAISALTVVVATKSGSGATALGTIVAKKSLTGGQFATPAMTQGFIIIAGVWYITNKPVSKFDESGWYSATPTLIS